MQVTKTTCVCDVCTKTIIFSPDDLQSVKHAKLVGFIKVIRRTISTEDSTTYLVCSKVCASKLLLELDFG